MNQFIRTAKTAVAAAGKILRDGFLQRHTLQFKDNSFHDVVTAIDRASERAMRRIVRRAFPTHAILGEEGGMRASAPSPYLWILDPVDGTTNYVHGMPMYNVTLALQERGRTILGVVYQPVTDERCIAIRGRGAWLGTQRVAVSTQTSLRRAYGFIEWRVGEARIRRQGLKIFTTLCNNRMRVRAVGSGALVLSYVGIGRSEYVISIDSKLWDVAAGVLMVQEGGGCVTDFHGEDLERVWRHDPFALTPLLATNGKMHKQLLHLVQK